MKGLDPIIENKPAFTLMGVGRDFKKENRYAEIPQFWNAYMAEDSHPFEGQFGICLDMEDAIRYLIADIYYPWIAVLPGWEPVTFEAGEWAMFPVDGPLPDALQKVNTYAWSKWVPENKEYKLRANYSLEFYPHQVRDSKYTHSEIWLPVRRRWFCGPVLNEESS